MDDVAVLDQPQHLIAIPSDRPWAEWPVPTVENFRVNELELDYTRNEDGSPATEDQRLLIKRVQFFEGDDVPLIEELGRANTHCLRELSTRVGFPVDFIQKLPIDLQAMVINQRILDARDQEFGFSVEGDEVTNIMPGWRGVLPHADVCELAYDALTKVYGEAQIDVARYNLDGLEVRFLLPFQHDVSPTRQLGDVLMIGIEIRHSYGMMLEVNLYAKRLVCLNGMTSSRNEFSWSQRTMGRPEHQRDWLIQGVERVLGNAENLVERSRRMAITTFEGDPRIVLRERARAMRLPLRFLPALFEAFDAEPGQTEWHLLNAFTRLGTHGTLPRNLARGVRHAAGDWAEDFDIVTARLPRPIALSVGAIIEAESDPDVPVE